jgi:hypothetical protein
VGIVGVVAIVGLLLWLFSGRRKRAAPAPEDDLITPIDRDELAEAERELAEDDGAREADDDAPEDWGPGRP